MMGLSVAPIFWSAASSCPALVVAARLTPAMPKWPLSSTTSHSTVLFMGLTP